MGRNKVDLVGQKFGRLTVIKFINKGKYKYYWLCKCDCSNKTIVRAGHLNDGRTRSCGCLAKENMRKVSKGRTDEKSYNWKGDSVGYEQLHFWIRKKLGKPQYCEFCTTTEDRMYHWASISGEYVRDFCDWLRLCVPCHSKFDNGKKSN